MLQPHGHALHPPLLHHHWIPKVIMQNVGTATSEHSTLHLQPQPSGTASQTPTSHPLIDTLKAQAKDQKAAQCAAHYYVYTSSCHTGKSAHGITFYNPSQDHCYHLASAMFVDDNTSYTNRFLYFPPCHAHRNSWLAYGRNWKFQGKSDLTQLTHLTGGSTTILILYPQCIRNHHAPETTHQKLGSHFLVVHLWVGYVWWEKKKHKLPIIFAFSCQYLLSTIQLYHQREDSAWSIAAKRIVTKIGQDWVHELFLT
jgi:hypothetical protein